MLRQDTILIEGRTYPCYVVHVTSDDSTSGLDSNSYTDTTLWIDKSALVFRKQVRHTNTYLLDGVNSAVRLPFLEDTTTVYPAADFGVQIAPETFRFTPPSDAKEVARLEPVVPPPPLQRQRWPANWLPTSRLPRRTAAKSLLPPTAASHSCWTSGPHGVARALPRCQPLTASTGMQRTGASPWSRSIRIVPPRTRPNTLLAITTWTNYHDADAKLGQAFKEQGIPPTVLIDGKGKIVYYAAGGDESAVRKAIAALGPEYASIAAPRR